MDFMSKINAFIHSFIVEGTDVKHVQHSQDNFW